jgi:hypothetical protein
MKITCVALCIAALAPFSCAAQMSETVSVKDAKEQTLEFKTEEAKTPLAASITIEMGRATLTNMHLWGEFDADLYSVQAIVDTVISKDMTDAEKALALFRVARDHAYPQMCIVPGVSAKGDLHWVENQDPIKLYNVHGHGMCDDHAKCLTALWTTAGLQCKVATAKSHVVTEVTYDGKSHFFDSFASVYYRLADGTVASQKDLQGNGALLDNPVTEGFVPWPGKVNNGFKGRYGAAKMKDVVSQYNPRKYNEYEIAHTMAATYRPGETLILNRANEDKWFGLDQDNKTPRKPDVFGNSYLIWETGAGKDAGLKALSDAKGLKLDGNISGTGSAAYKVKVPYLIVGGTLSGKIEAGSARFKIGDKVVWEGKAGEIAADFSDAVKPTDKSVCYGYDLVLELDDARIAEMRVKTIMMNNPLALPTLTAGKSRINFKADSLEDGPISVTLKWAEGEGRGAPKGSRAVDVRLGRK